MYKEAEQHQTVQNTNNAHHYLYGYKLQNTTTANIAMRIALAVLWYDISNTQIKNEIKTKPLVAITIKKLGTR